MALQLFPYQETGAEFLVSRKRCGLFDEPGVGKAQPLTARVRVKDGWKAIGDIQVGDGLIGYDGRGGRVVGVYDRGILDTYIVTFNDGATTRVSADHLWRVKSPTSTWYVAPTWLVADRMRCTKIWIPTTAPVGREQAPAALPIDPYLFGLLLGDGGLTGHSVKYTTADSELAAYCAAQATKLGLRFVPSGEYDYRFSGAHSGSENCLLTALRSVGAMGHGSLTKRIPRQYMDGSIEQRLAMLQGLMDTDGWIVKESGRVGFASGSPALTDGVCELVQSLGGTARASSKTTASGNLTYILSINTPTCPFRLTRKMRHWAAYEHHKPKRMFRSIEKVGAEPMRCIAVTTADRCYLTDNYIVTHNSAQSIRALDKLGIMRAMVIAPASARANWLGEFKKFSTRYRRIVKGITVHDYVSWERGVFDVIITSYEQATRWSSHIRAECEVIDAVIIDEGHNLRNRETNRGRAILGPQSDGVGGIIQWAAYAWWLTGTPLWNDPSDVRTFLTFCNVMPLSHSAFIKRYFNSRPTTYSTRNTAKLSMLPELRALIGNNSMRRTLAQTGVELPPIFFSSALVDGDDAAVTDLLLSSPGLDQAIITALQEGRGISNLDSDHVATLRRLIGEAKALPYAAMLLDDLRSGLDKCVSFGIHRNALKLARDHLWRHGIDAAIVNGETTSTEDERNFARFDNDPTLRVLLCNVRKAGTALTMTASCHVDMMESDWTPNGNWQAIKRVYRLSQVRTVRARFITLADSFDEIVNQIVSEKAQAIAAIDGSPILPLA